MATIARATPKTNYLNNRDILKENTPKQEKLLFLHQS